MTRKVSNRSKIKISTNISFEKIAEFAEKDWNRFQAECQRLCKDFHSNVIPYLPYDPQWEVALSQMPYYRVVNPLFSPSSPSGSLADGARMNIGGAQSSRFAMKTFGPLASKRGAVYLASSWETAVWETFGHDSSFTYAVKQIKSHKHKDLYKFETKPGYGYPMAIDFESAYSALNPTFRLDSYFAITHDMNGLWGDLKTPAPIQIFAAWLISKTETSRCIRFPSTADPSDQGMNFCFYMKDDDEAKATFAVKRFEGF